MPLFFFDVRTPRGVEPDDIGSEFGSVEAAYLEACKAIPGMLVDLQREGEHARDLAFEIRDEAGRELWQIPFNEIYDAHGRLRLRSATR
ncbi:DUF6894 family protein [Methylobacterium radiodurans]|uniref:DUF6894 domain-containing protein n=1 Tax=Methylobacterium radiodurans TaxID=2202828 RepID=A0A2U8VY04_9HYPH|nr:hypothetical protein [Methylobacterium radiodurans]AWN38170.1 hypothetical protein DK427_22535 [Methylobacterium radiodurans]